IFVQEGPAPVQEGPAPAVRMPVPTHLLPQLVASAVANLTEDEALCDASCLLLVAVFSACDSLRLRIFLLNSVAGPSQLRFIQGVH
ncbi:unnamed protein product, partial [Polarella glacialis]